MKLRQRRDVNYAGAPLPDQLGSGILQPGDCAAPEVVDDIEDAETGGTDKVLDDVSADSSDEEGAIGVATSGEKVKRPRKGQGLRANKKVAQYLTGPPTESILRYAEAGINNVADPATEVEGSDSDDSAFQVSHRKSVLISRKRKVLAHPGGEQHKSRLGLRDSRPIRYKDMSSSDDENGKALEGGNTICGQEGEPTPAKMSTLQTKKTDGQQVYYTRRARKKDALPGTVEVLHKEAQADSSADKGKGESVKQYRRLRKKVDSPSSDYVDDFAQFAHDRKVRQRNKDVESMSTELQEGSSHVAPSSPLRKQPSRACARKQVVDNPAEEWHYVSDEDSEVKPPRGKGKGAAPGSRAAATASMQDTGDQDEDMEALPYSVCRYGLCTVAGDYLPLRKRIFNTVEKVLSVRNVADDNERVFCVKEHDRSYRAVLFVAEKLLQHHSPQLLRNFLKRMQTLGRADGHDGDDEKGPAFDPRFIEVDRVFGFQVKGSKKLYYVKWRNLPYSESTWEDESSLRYDRNVIRRYLAINKRGMRCDAWKFEASFKDGRTLRDYQEEGVNWLDREYENKTNCILADEMGLGKTIQSVAMLEILRSKRRKKGPFLVVAPVSTLGHWLRELQSLTDMNCIVYGGNPEDRQIIRDHEFFFAGMKQAKFHVLLTSFEILLKDQTVLSKQNWEYVIIDEAHRLKAKDSKTTSAVKYVIKSVDEGGLLLLTGTPVQNNMKEIFGLLSLLDPVNFASEDAFLFKYGDLKDAEQVKELQDLILRPRLLRRLKEDVEKSIPQKEETIIWVELTKDQRVYYKAIYENSVHQLLKGSQAANMSSLRNVAMELRKVCNHPFLCTGLEQDLVWKHQKSAEPERMKLLRESSGKMVLVDKLLPSLKEAGRRVLIFSQFTSMLDLLEEYLVSRKYSFERIDGKIRGTERQSAIDRYSAKGSDIFVFLLSTRAGGLGITLTAADTCIIYDSDWNPQNDLQAMARCHRIGQTKDVRIYRLITRKTYEQQLFECSSKKYGLDEAILGNRLGADADQAHMQNIENLLKNGAYDFLKDDGEEEAAAFSAQNIDQILEQRTQKRLIGGSGCNTFSVATFDSNEKGEDTRLEQNPLEQPTEKFWHELLPEAYEAAKAAMATKGSKAANLLQEVPIGRRRRARIDYAEHRQTSDDEFANGQKKSLETKKIVPGSDAAVLASSSVDSEEESVGQWTELELKHLEERMMSLGRSFSRAEQIQSEARLGNYPLDEVKEVMETVISYCEWIRDNVESIKDMHEVVQNSERKMDDNRVQEPTKPIPSIPACIEKAMSSGVVHERLKKNSARLLDRLHERTVLEDFLSSNQQLPPNLPRKNKLPQLWGEKEDLDLLRGALRHGHSKFKKMRMDNTLCFNQFPSNKLDAKSSVSGEDVQELDSWPSDAVLTSRLRRLIEALPNGINQRVLKRKAAEVEARSEQRNQKMSSKLDVQGEKDSQKNSLKVPLPMVVSPENGQVRDKVGSCVVAEDENLVLKKVKAMELRQERQMQLKASQWQNSIRDAFIRESALREAQIQSALGRECVTSPATNHRTQAIELDTKNHTDLQFAEYEAATKRAMSSSAPVDFRLQQENCSKSSPDLKQLNQAAPLMGMKQLVRHISPSPYVKDHEDLAITALPPERPKSKEEIVKGSQFTSSSTMTDSGNKENEIPHRKKLSLPRDSDLKSKISKGNHKQQTLISFLTKTSIT